MANRSGHPASPGVSMAEKGYQKNSGFVVIAVGFVVIAVGFVVIAVGLPLSNPHEHWIYFFLPISQYPTKGDWEGTMPFSLQGMCLQKNKKQRPPPCFTPAAKCQPRVQCYPSYRRVMRDKCENTERVPQGNTPPCSFTSAFPSESVSRPTHIYRGRFAATKCE